MLLRHLLRLALLAAVGVAWAADPEPYTVVLPKTGDAALDQILADSSTLASLRENAPVGPFALVARAQGDVERFAAALDSNGYYKAKVQLRIAGRALDDPGLLEALERAPADPPAEITVTVDLGPLFHLRKVEVQGDVPETALAKLEVKPGAPALAQAVLAGREQLLNAVLNEGHALAKVDLPMALLAPEADALDVIYKVQAGPRVELGQIALQGLQDVNEDYVRRRLLVAYGDPYHPDTLEKARQDLTTVGVFSTVRVTNAGAVDAQGRLPMTFELTERPRHSTSLGAAFSTDVGGSMSTTWQHRNLFGNAEQLNLTLGVTQLGGNSTTGIGYKALVGFIKPDFYERDQSLQANVGFVKQRLIAYDQKAATADIALSRKFADHWSGSVGLAFEQSQITQQGVTRNYTLFSVPLSVKYDSSNSLLDPTQGVRANASLTPVLPLAGDSSSPFVLIQASGSTYLDLAEPGQSVLALRGTVGLAEGASQFGLPPDKRFYAGGSATVRGFRFQSIGPLFPNNDPQGGTAMAAGTVEFRQRFWENYGVVAFADAGQVNVGGVPFTGIWRLGAGVGARYYTGFGPIRLDIAVPVTQQDGSSAFEAYIGLGQAF